MSGTPALRELRTVTPPPLRRRALHAMERAFEWSGTGAAYARMAAAGGAIILMYHSVPAPAAAPWIDARNAVDPATFAAQMRFLAAHRSVVSMTELADLLDAGAAPPRGTVVLTFDDGYSDNLDVVAPVLAELGLPATLYLPTGYVRRGGVQWVDRLYAAFRARSRDTLALAGPAVRGEWSLADEPSARAAYSAVCDALIGARDEDRGALLDEIAAQLAPSSGPPRLTLDWDAVRALTARWPRFEIGGHTVGHADLTRLDAAACRDEIAGCADEILRETGKRPVHFSFPYGRSSPESRRVVAECGFRTAVADGADVLVRPGADLFALPRIEAPASPSLFRFRTSGAYPDLPRRLLGRA